MTKAQVLSFLACNTAITAREQGRRGQASLQSDATGLQPRPAPGPSYDAHLFGRQGGEGVLMAQPTKPRSAQLSVLLSPS